MPGFVSDRNEMKIAVFLPNWIGDAVMATPALRAIRRTYHNAEMVAVLRPYVVPVLDGLKLADRMLVHDPRGANAESRGMNFIKSLRSERFDWAILFPNSLRSGWLAWLSGSKRRVGFARNGRGILLTDALVPKSPTQPNPVIDEYLRLAEHIGCKQLDRKTELATLPVDEQKLNSFWSKHDPRLRTRGIVCLNPGGAFGAAKHWPVQSFGSLANRIAEQLGRTVLVTCGPSERDEARSIAQIARHHNVLSLADEPMSIGLTKAAIKSAELLVTTDSGPRHFAPPFGVPVITLFGPTHIAWSETYVPNAVHLQHQVDCGPCQHRVCPLGHHRCMQELSADRVFAAVETLLAQTGRQRGRAS
jgi:heptosyltransferase-2